MDSFLGGVLFGVVAVLTLDMTGAFLSRRLGFPYARLSPISLLLWATAGGLASRGVVSDPAGSIALGCLSGLIVGLIDSTVGWWISWRLGVGRLKPELMTTRRISKVILRVTMLAAGTGAAAALLVAVVSKLIGQSKV